MTSGSDFTRKAERKIASRTAREATCCAMSSPAVNAAAETARRSAGSIRGRLIVRPRRLWLWNERIY